MVSVASRLGGRRMTSTAMVRGRLVLAKIRKLLLTLVVVGLTAGTASQPAFASNKAKIACDEAAKTGSLALALVCIILSLEDIFGPPVSGTDGGDIDPTAAVTPSAAFVERLVNVDGTVQPTLTSRSTKAALG